MEEPLTVTIFLAKPSGTYDPGQIVAGRIVIITSGEEEVRGVEIKLEGNAIVQFDHHRTKDKDDDDDCSDDEDISDKLSGSQKVAENVVTYLDMTNYYRLGIGGDRGQILRRGETTYAFTFQLPSKILPCNFNGKYGKIQYFVKASVHRSFWKIDCEAKRSIQINSVVDLNKIPEARLPGEWKASKIFGVLCCKSGPLSIDVRMDRRGYCPGDVIRVQVGFDNLSRRTVNNLTAKFVQDTNYIGEQNEKKFSKVLVTRKRGEAVDAGESGSWEVKIDVPNDIPPTGLGGCKIIDVQYFLKIEAHVFGVVSNLKQDCNIVIGTVALAKEELKRDETTDTFVPDENSEQGKWKNEIYPDLGDSVLPFLTLIILFILNE